MGSLKQAPYTAAASTQSVKRCVVPRLPLELLQDMESPRAPDLHPTKATFNTVEPFKDKTPMFPPLPQHPRVANDCELFTATLGPSDGNSAKTRIRIGSANGTASSDPTPRTGAIRPTPPSSRGSSAGRPSSSSGRVIVSELGDGRANPNPVVTEEADNLLEEYLSPRKLRALTGTEDLDEVKFLEMKVDSREMSLGNFGMYLPNLEQLKLSNSIIRTVRDLGSQLSSVRVLWLAQCGVQELDGLGSMTSLHELYLAYNEVCDLSPCTMLEKLQILDVEGNHVSEVSQLQFLALCPCLKCLTLENNPICLTPHPDTADRNYNYRNEVKILLPQLQLLDDEPLNENDPGPEHVNDLFKDDWKLLAELEKEGMTPGAEETVQLEFSVRPGTGAPPLTSYRPGSALRPYTAGLGNNSISPSYRPGTARPATAGSSQSEEDGESAGTMEDASDLTRGLLLSGNLARALKLKREQGKPKRLKDCPKLLEQLERLRDEGKLDRRGGHGDEANDTDLAELMNELEVFKKDHSKIIQMIDASKAPQILRVNHDTAEDIPSDNESDVLSSDDGDDEINLPPQPLPASWTTPLTPPKTPAQVPQNDKPISPMTPPTRLQRQHPFIRSPTSPPTAPQNRIRKGKLASVPLLPTKPSPAAGPH